MTQIIHSTKNQFDQGQYINTELDNQGVMIIKRINLLNNSSFFIDCNPNECYEITGLAYLWNIWMPGESSDNYKSFLIYSPDVDIYGKTQQIDFTSNSGREIFLGQSIYNDYPYDRIITPNTDYTFSAYVKLNNSNNDEVSLIIEFWIDNTTKISVVSSGYVSPTTVTRLEVTGISPVNCNSLRTWVLVRPKGGVPNSTVTTFWVDKAQLELSTIATAYIEKNNTQGKYISPPVYVGDYKNPHKLEITGSFVVSTSVFIQIRSANTVNDLNNAVWYGQTSTSDFYSCIVNTDRLKEWSINLIHTTDNYIQYKIDFLTTLRLYTPKLHDIRITYGSSIPEVHDMILSLISATEPKYKFKPGDSINITIKVVEHTGYSNISSVDIEIYDNNNTLTNSGLMQASATPIDSFSIFYEYNYTFPLQEIYLGTWEIKTTVQNTDLQTVTENTFIKVSKDYIIPPNKFLVASLGDYGFGGVFDSTWGSPDQIIAKYKSMVGNTLWKCGLNWGALEFKQGVFNQVYVDFLIRWMDEAYASGAKVQIGIAQQWWSEWVNNDEWNTQTTFISRDTYKYLIDTWLRLSDLVKNHPAMDSYLIIEEENNIVSSNTFDYIKTNNKIISTLRANDRNPAHRIVIRPNYRPVHYSRTKIGNNGNHDFDYGTGTYPTGAQWFPLGQENPISFTSYFTMDVFLRNSPLMFNTAMGVGEIGFFKSSQDNFGDPEKLIAFKRAMTIAYDMGFEEFILWETGFGFENPTVYFPQLVSYSNELLLKPRLTRFNVRVLNDLSPSGEIYDGFIKTPYVSFALKYQLDKQQEIYYFLVRYLDEHGYSWYVTTSQAAPYQSQIYDTTISLSEITNLSVSEQNILIKERLKNIISNGSVLSWNEIECLKPLCIFTVF